MKKSKYLIPENYFRYATRNFLNFFYPKEHVKILQTNYNKVKMLVRANEDVGKDILVKRFEINELKFIKNLLSNDAVFIDIGSNIGMYSLVVASSSSTIKVHAFDPIKLNNALLTSSIEINGLENIVVNETCVGNYDGFIGFSVASDSAYSSIHDSGRKSELKKITLPIVKLDTYVAKMKLQRIDFIKIDVEGAEMMVIEGANELFSNLSLRPKMMMVELCDKNLRAFNTSVNEIVIFLDDLNYKPYVLVKNKLIEFVHYNHANAIENIFFKDIANV